MTEQLRPKKTALPLTHLNEVKVFIEYWLIVHLNFLAAIGFAFRFALIIYSVWILDWKDESVFVEVDHGVENYVLFTAICMIYDLCF